MNIDELLYQGAEAKIYKSTYNSLPCIIKERFEKKYRIAKLDIKLRKGSFKREIKALQKCIENNILVPKLYYSDDKNFKIYMEYIENGYTLKDFLKSKINIKDIKYVLEKLAQLIAKIHSIGIIHGDLTTTNIFVLENNTKFIIYDFGLCQFSTTDENRAVDLYVFKRSLFATWNINKELNHFDLFSYFLEIYDLNLQKYSEPINTSNKKSHIQKVVARFYEVEKRGRKRDMIG